MTTLDDISVLEYFNLEDSSEYDFFIDLMKPENKLCGRSWGYNDMTFNEFKTIILIFNEPTYSDIQDLFLHLYSIRGNIKESPESIFQRESVFQFFKAKNFVKKIMQEKLELEDRLLGGDKDPILEQIDAYNRLAPVNTMLTKIRLAEQFGVTPKEVGDWKYNEVLNIQIANKISSQIDKEYNDKRYSQNHR